jgi:ferredoxin
LLLPASAIRAADLIPVPEFSNHLIPTVQLVSPRAAWHEYADVAMLTAGLALASYFALRSRSRRGLFLLCIVSLAWLGFWRQGCVCPIGAIQNVAMAAFDPGYAVPAMVVAIFVLPLVFTLFFGRTFCSAVCPLGAVQELVALRPVRVPTWLDHVLGLLAYVYLGAAVLLAATGTAFLICRYDPFVGLFRMSAGREMLYVAAAFLVVGIFVGRPYCRYLCPYGAILSLLSRASRWNLRIPPKECVQCRLCEDACPYGAIRPPTVIATHADRRVGRRRLAVCIALLPALVAAGAVLGRKLETPLAKMHPTVALAERVRLEEIHEVSGTTDASDAFRNTGRPAADLYCEARLVSHRLGLGGAWFGAWVGLVLGVKLIQLSVRRRRTEYEPDPGRCVSCGRCFWYCPNEQARQGWIAAATLKGPVT